MAAVGCLVATSGCTGSAAEPVPSEPVVVPERTDEVTQAPAPAPAAVDDVAAPVSPLVIAHRGASGYRPEHTIAAFELAVEMGADVLEPDVVMTSDGHAVIRHENQLDLTTDVGERPEFADRRTTKTIDGRERTGWFSEDFTLDEISQLRSVERNPDLRPESARFDGEFGVLTFRDFLAFVRDVNEGRTVDIGVYPELKHPSHFGSLGLDIADRVVTDLADFGYEDSADFAFIQSREVGVLRRLDAETDLRLVQLLGNGAPFDQQIVDSGLTFADMATPDGLEQVGVYADGIGVAKNDFVVPLDEAGALDTASMTTLVEDAHDASLFVHAYTFRAENRFLPSDLRSSGGDADVGDLVAEIRVFTAAGVDGVFVDHVDLGRRAVDGL